MRSPRLHSVEDPLAVFNDVSAIAESLGAVVWSTPSERRITVVRADDPQLIVDAILADLEIAPGQQPRRIVWDNGVVCSDEPYEVPEQWSTTTPHQNPHPWCRPGWVYATSSSP